MKRTQFAGSFLIVEGDSDARLYKRLINVEECQIVDGHGKENVLHALELLEKEKFAGVSGLVDANHWMLDGNLPILNNLVVTDFHDLELMLIRSVAFDKILFEFGSVRKIRNFEARSGKDVRTVLVEAAVPLGCLRWVSSREKLGLRFEGLAFERFTERESLSVDVGTLVKTVKDHSQKPSLAEGELQTEILTLQEAGWDPWQLCCGHDVVSILSIGLRKSLGSNNSRQVEADLIERSLRLGYESAFFYVTRLYAALSSWQEANIPFKIF